MTCIPRDKVGRTLESPVKQEARGRHRRKKAPPCDEPGFLAAQVFAIAAETGWSEERILFMPMSRLAQYQHCLLRRNGVRAHWSGTGEGQTGLREQMEALRVQWSASAEP